LADAIATPIFLPTGIPESGNVRALLGQREPSCRVSPSRRQSGIYDAPRNSAGAKQFEIYIRKSLPRLPTMVLGCVREQTT
jgi:hypothetical protein